MRNLEIYGVQELNAREIRETDGGLFGLDDMLIGITVAVVAGVIADWDNFKIGISGNIK